MRTARKQNNINPEPKRRTARKQYRINPESKRRTARKQYSTNSESKKRAALSNIIIILGETRLPHVYSGLFSVVVYVLKNELSMH